MNKTLFLAPLVILQVACSNGGKECAAHSENDSTACFRTLDAEAGSECNIKFAEVTFTRALNGADTLATVQEDGRMLFRAGEKQDFFCDPDEKLTNNTAPILLTEVDNTKPFSLTTKITPQFTETGLYNAGVLYIYANDRFWQKFCFEQDERGNHRVVSVRTMGTSDDNNHDVVSQDWVYMRIFSDTHTVALYYSLDGKEWQMVRLYKNNYPEKVFLGISNQCPIDKCSQSYFEELTLTSEDVSDIRMGN